MDSSFRDSYDDPVRISSSSLETTEGLADSIRDLYQVTDLKCRALRCYDSSGINRRVVGLGYRPNSNQNLALENVCLFELLDELA